MEALNEKVETLEKENVKLNSEVDDFKDDLDQKDKQIAKLKKQIEELNQDLAKSKDSLDACYKVEPSNISQEAVKELQSNVSELSKVIKSKNKKKTEEKTEKPVE